MLQAADQGASSLVSGFSDQPQQLCQRPAGSCIGSENSRNTRLEPAAKTNRIGGGRGVGLCVRGLAESLSGVSESRGFRVGFRILA